MLTVMVCLLASGNSSTRRPLAIRYSVMPSTVVIFSGAAACCGGGGVCLILRASAAGSSATHKAAVATIVRKVEGIPCSLVTRGIKGYLSPPGKRRQPRIGSIGYRLSVAARLQREQLRVDAVLGHERLVVAA